jgi:hypothetical protein
VSASWAAVMVSVVLALAAIGRELLARGARDGKIDKCMEQLTKIAEDHEGRIRLLEGAPGRWIHVTPPDRLRRPIHSSPPGHTSATTPRNAVSSRRKPDTASWARLGSSWGPVTPQATVPFLLS